MIPSSVSNVALIVFVIVLASFIIAYDGVLVGRFWDLVLLCFFLLLPILRNREQLVQLAHDIQVASSRASVQDATNEVPQGGEREVRTLCYNIFMRPSLWFIKNNDSDYKNERLSAFLDHLDSYDIICLQEMFGLLSFRQRRLLSEAQKRGFSHAAVAGAPPYLLWDRHGSFKIPFLDAGLVILSRHAIVETDSHYYTLGNQIDGWAPKQVLWAFIKLPNTGGGGGDNYIHVFNTHMQASYYDAPSNSSDMARAKQVNELAQFVREKVFLSRTQVYPALILGDFNLDSRAPRVGQNSAEQQHSLDYVRMMDILQRELQAGEVGYMVRDLMWESYHDHPVTYGDVIVQQEEGEEEKKGEDKKDVSQKQGGKWIPRETVLTHTADHGCAISIDYAFFLGPREETQCHIIHKGTKVEPFFVNNEAGPCTQLSDHYGIVSNFITK